MTTRAGIVAGLMMMACGARAFGYVDLAPTLGKVVSQSANIAVVEVTAYDAAAHVVTLKEVKTLKGKAAPAAIKQALSPDDEPVPRSVRIWAVPGSQGVMFASGNAGLVCVGEGWYAVRLSVNGEWKMGDDRPDLPLAYYGSAPRLIDAIQKMLAGKEAVITLVPHGNEGGAASFELALNRPALPGLVRLERLRASLSMPETTIAVSGNPTYVIGPGVVDEDDLPALIAKLTSGDARARVAAADDIGTLGTKGAPAARALAELLGGSDAQVACAAASALLRVMPKDQQAAQGALAVLTRGMAAADAGLRRDAARESGLSGDAGAPLAPTLGALLKDSDGGVRVSALEAIATLGPAAGKAEAAVEPLLDQPEMTIDAADALGRMGLAARPAMPRLAKLLTFDDDATRWAGVRAMAQIGGPNSKPAVDFIVAKFAEKDRSKQPTEVEGYNMMVYLAMFGPDAREALATAQSGGIKNPALNGIATWALQSDKFLPWQTGGGGFGGGGFGGRGGGPGGMGGGPGNIGTIIYEAYVREMGPRLAPAAKLLAAKIADGTAGDVPAWGYELLADGRDDAVKILTPLLTDSDQTKRERALVALGFMGEAAGSAANAVQSEPGSDPHEKLLAAWCLRAIHGQEEAQGG